MTRRLLGRTGLMVSAISLGTVELGLDYGLGSNSRPTPSEAERLIHYALDHGINHLDTARAYGDSEAIIGAALGPRRQQVILTTKVAVNPLTLTESLETSLRRLRTDYVDIVMLHAAPEDSLTAPAVIDPLLALQAKGYFHHLGASVYGPLAARTASDSGLFSCLQIAYSPLDRRLETRFTQTDNVGLIARSVLLKGALTHRYRDLPSTYSELQAAIATLDSLGLPLPELAYRYVLNSPIATALAGTAQITELEQILSYAELGPLPFHLPHPNLPDHWLNPGLWPSG